MSFWEKLLYGERGNPSKKSSNTKASDPALRLDDAPFPRILLVGDHPEIERLSAVLENIAPRCGFFIKDIASPNWNQQTSFKAIQRKFETLTSDEMKRIACDIWGQGCLSQPSCLVTVTQLELMGCLMLTIAKDYLQQAAACEADSAGYLPNFFPIFGGCRIDAMYIVDPAKADQVLSRYQTARSLTGNRGGNLDFEVRFTSGREMASFMGDLMGVMKPYTKISDIRCSYYAWQICKHGRYYCDAWGKGMTACADCVRAGAKPWVRR